MNKTQIEKWAELIKESQSYNEAEIEDYEEEDTENELTMDDLRSDFVKYFPVVWKYNDIHYDDYKTDNEYFGKIVKPFLKSIGMNGMTFDEVYDDIKAEYNRFQDLMAYSERPKTTDMMRFLFIPSDSTIYEDAKWYMLPADCLNDIFEDEKYDSVQDKKINKFARFIVENKLVDYFLESYDPEMDELTK